MENDRRIIRDKIARIGSWGASSAGCGLDGPIILNQEPKLENIKDNEIPAVDHAPLKEPATIWAPNSKRQITW